MSINQGSSVDDQYLMSGLLYRKQFIGVARQRNVNPGWYVFKSPDVDAGLGDWACSIDLDPACFAVEMSRPESGRTEL